MLVKVTAAIHLGLAKVNGRIHFRKHRRAISAGDDLWIAKVLALVHVKEGRTSNFAEMAFVQYMEYTHPHRQPRRCAGLCNLAMGHSR